MSKTKTGFTIIEVMLFLGITGLMLIGVLGGTYSTIERQRFSDSVRSYSEFLRTVYSEVISPESFGEVDSAGVGNNQASAVYGKVVAFGNPNDADDHNIYTATIVGDIYPNSSSDNFISQLGGVNARLYCGSNSAGKQLSTTLEQYTPLWEAKIENTNKAPFTGTLIIARSPESGTVRAAYTDELKLDLLEQCQPTDNRASVKFQEFLTDRYNNPANKFRTSGDLEFCVRSANNRTVRGVNLLLESRNTSAITMTSMDGEDNKCR